MHDVAVTCSECSTPSATLRRGLCRNCYMRWRRKAKREGADLSNRRHAIALDMSDAWTPQKAWLLGAMMGDGHVRAQQAVTKAGNRVAARCFFVSGDRDLTERVRDMIMPSVPITLIAGGHRAHFSSVEVAGWFSRKMGGVSGKKSVNLAYPDLPAEFRPHLLRGLWDTDGHIGMNDGRAFLGMKAPILIRAVGADVTRMTGMVEGREFTIRPTGVKTEIRFTNRENSIRWLDLIYADSEGMRCDRKFREYESSRLTLFRTDDGQASSTVDSLCLICGRESYARSLCKDHMMRSRNISLVEVDPAKVLAALDAGRNRDVDWALKLTIRSFLEARYDMKVSPGEFMRANSIVTDGTEASVKTAVKAARSNFRVGTVSWFPVRLAIETLKAMGFEPGWTVFDPFAGWGARLTGTLACSGRYIGVDLNRSLIVELRKWIDMLGERAENAKVIHANAAHVAAGAISGIPESFEAVMTSPPYWVKEFYSDDPGQPHYFSGYADFMESLIYPVLRFVAARTTKFGVIFCKNLRVEQTNYMMADDVVAYLSGLGLEVSADTFHAKRSQIHPSDFLETRVVFKPRASLPTAV